MNLLESERETHLLYALLRKEQKAAGLRFPPHRHVTPQDPARWHGDERVGATEYY